MNEIDEFISATDPFLNLAAFDPLDDFDDFDDFDDLDAALDDAEIVPEAKGHPAPRTSNAKAKTNQQASGGKTTTRKRRHYGSSAAARRAIQNREAQRRHRDRARSKVELLEMEVTRLQAEVANYRRVVSTPDNTTAAAAATAAKATIGTRSMEREASAAAIAPPPPSSPPMVEIPLDLSAEHHPLCPSSNEPMYVVDFANVHPLSRPESWRKLALASPHLVRTSEDCWQELTWIDLLLTKTLDLVLLLEHAGLDGLGALLKKGTPPYGMSAALGRRAPSGLLEALGCEVGRDFGAMLHLPIENQQSLRETFKEKNAGMAAPAKVVLKHYLPKFASLAAKRHELARRVRQLLASSDAAGMMAVAVANLGVVSATSSSLSSEASSPRNIAMELEMELEKSASAASLPCSHPTSEEEASQRHVIAAPIVTFASFLTAMQILALVADGSLRPLLVELRELVRDELALRSEAADVVFRRVLDPQRAAYVLRHVYPAHDVRGILHVWSVAFGIDVEGA